MVIDTQIIAFIAIFIGAICGTFIPYLLKAKDEGLPFNYTYIYGMVFGLIVAAFAVLPSSVEVAFKPLFGLFLAGAGLQVAINKANTARIKRTE